MSPIVRPALAATVMIIPAYAAAAVGLIDLIAQGYGLLTYESHCPSHRVLFSP